jgi:ssDNA-binding Zn-finger/Zn-ribbon topoisomerase 1
MSETIQFTCPACDTVFVVSTSLRGTKLSCPNCENISVVSADAPENVSRTTAHVAGSSNRAKLVASIANYGRHSRPPAGFCCPFCKSILAPKVKRKISTGGWMTFVALLIFCFPLCFIGLFIKEEYRVCRSCGIKLD